MTEPSASEPPFSGAGQHVATYPRVWQAYVTLGNATLAIKTLGFPAAMDAFSWINDILDKTEPGVS